MSLVSPSKRMLDSGHTFGDVVARLPTAGPPQFEDIYNKACLLQLAFVRIYPVSHL